jgi:hypothetical protein
MSISGSGNVIGGVAPNVVAFNTGAGVSVASGTGNDIQQNSIYGNTGLGIDLGGDGVTANDAGDGDTGANNLQNFPSITVAHSSGLVQGAISSTPASTFVIRLYVSPSCVPGTEAKTALGTVVANTDGSGFAAWVFNAPFLNIGNGITATATDPAGNTSELSACLQVLSGHHH